MTIVDRIIHTRMFTALTLEALTPQVNGWIAGRVAKINITFLPPTAEYVALVELIDRFDEDAMMPVSKPVFCTAEE